MFRVSFRYILPAFLGPLIFSAFYAHQSVAREEAPSSECQLTTRLKARITKIYPGGTLQLEDGRRVRLVNLVYPKPIENKDADIHTISGKQPTRLVSWLKQHLLGQKVELAFGKKDQHFDRYDRLLAHIFVQKNGKRFWVQKQLVESGLAMIRPWPQNRACLDRLINAERKIYRRIKSVKKDGFCRGRADYLGHLYSNKHHFCVVRGKVHKVTRTRKNIYINFAENWRQDFTAVLPVKSLRAFRKAGVKPKDFAGEQVEVRGWLDVWNGPFIRIKQPEQIRVIGEGSSRGN